MYYDFKFINYKYVKQVVANYYGNKKEYEPVPGKSIHWAGGRKTPPLDTPVCGFDGTKCPPDGNSLPYSVMNFLSYV